MRNIFKKYNSAKLIIILLFNFVGLQGNGFSQTSKSDKEEQIEIQEDTIRVDTNLVTIPTTVFDREGRYVTNMRKEDFQVFEDGVEQKIELFETVEQPFTVLLLLDVSGSMATNIGELTRAANTFVSRLRPDDQIIAATFDDTFNVVLKSTKISNLNKSLKLRPRSGIHATMLYDAVYDALKMIKKVRGRKAIILFSDGMGEGTFGSAKGNLQNAEENEALIYTVQFSNSFTVLPKGFDKEQFYKGVETADNYMRDLASITGGRPYKMENIADLEKTFGLIADELRQQYSLGYYPKEIEKGQKKQVRQIKVKVNQLNLAVRARSSYVIEKK
ncbi:hypothetical protein BH10ACI1_BH10ACI1_34460 [soil metagenome]